MCRPLCGWPEPAPEAAALVWWAGLRGAHRGNLHLGHPLRGDKGQAASLEPNGEEEWKLRPDDQRVGLGGRGLGWAGAVPCTSMCRMPRGYFYACQGNSVIYGRPGPLQGCVINTPGPELLFRWRGRSAPVLSLASLPTSLGPVHTWPSWGRPSPCSCLLWWPNCPWSPGPPCKEDFQMLSGMTVICKLL